MSSTPQLSLFEAHGGADGFAVRVSPRARRLTVRVHVGGRVEIVVPRGVPVGTVRAFVSRNTGWIDRKIVEMGARSSPVPVVPESVAFAATGESFEIRWTPAERRRLRHGTNAVQLEGRDVPAALGLLRDWLVQAARRRLVPQIWELSRELGLTMTGATIRRQRTRWGSCSCRGRISLNCSLLFMPAPVVRYLMVHELSHLQHLNHSGAFWRTVESHEPDYRRLDQALTAGWRAVPDWVFKG